VVSIEILEFFADLNLVEAFRVEEFDLEADLLVDV
jgi:hypothetical protein